MTLSPRIPHSTLRPALALELESSRQAAFLDTSPLHTFQGRKDVITCGRFLCVQVMYQICVRSTDAASAQAFATTGAYFDAAAAVRVLCTMLWLVSAPKHEKREQSCGSRERKEEGRVNKEKMASSSISEHL